MQEAASQQIASAYVMPSCMPGWLAGWLAGMHVCVHRRMDVQVHALACMYVLTAPATVATTQSTRTADTRPLGLQVSEHSEPPNPKTRDPKPERPFRGFRDWGLGFRD